MKEMLDGGDSEHQLLARSFFAIAQVFPNKDSNKIIPVIYWQCCSCAFLLILSCFFCRIESMFPCLSDTSLLDEARKK